MHISSARLCLHPCEQRVSTECRSCMLRHLQHCCTALRLDFEDEAALRGRNLPSYTPHLRTITVQPSAIVDCTALCIWKHANSMADVCPRTSSFTAAASTQPCCVSAGVRRQHCAILALRSHCQCSWPCACTEAIFKTEICLCG